MLYSLALLLCASRHRDVKRPEAQSKGIVKAVVTPVEGRQNSYFSIESSFDRDIYLPGRKVGGGLTGTCGPTSWLFLLFVDDLMIPNFVRSREAVGEFRRIAAQIDLPVAHAALKGSIINPDGLSFQEMCSVGLMLDYRAYSSKFIPHENVKSRKEATDWLRLIESVTTQSLRPDESAEAFMIRFASLEFDGCVSHRIEAERHLLQQLPPDYPTFKLSLWRRLSDDLAEAGELAAARSFDKVILDSSEFSGWDVSIVSSLEQKLLLQKDRGVKNLGGRFGRVW